ncbi:MAG TPA: CaiB/BaiF CoA-transferase family protein [Nannocystaceae bacterium]|nr:CaiB/BaiF CoA-transferase family protein [Nannocystaceae bacterium]
MSAADDDAPLAGIVVLDLTRMIPGATAARMLVDLGADVVKIEDPRGGDPMRMMPPVRDGIGVGFAACYRGAQSVALRLGTEPGNAGLRAMIGRADVLLESFRPGTLARFGLPPADLCREHPRLVVCSLPGYPAADPAASDVAHDLNTLARTGLLARLHPEPAVPRVQIADVTCGLLAGASVVTALFARTRTGRGRWIEQPLVSGALPHVLMPWADLAACGEIGATERLIGGRVPAYSLYRCGDGRAIAVGCLEPKFWVGLCEAVGVPQAVAGGLRDDAEGERARAWVAEELARAPAAEWARRLTDAGLPVDVVDDVHEARGRAGEWFPSLVEQTPMPGGEPLELPGPALPSFAAPVRAAAPRLGEHTESALRRLGASEDVIRSILGG